MEILGIKIVSLEKVFEYEVINNELIKSAKDKFWLAKKENGEIFLISNEIVKRYCKNINDLENNIEPETDNDLFSETKKRKNKAKNI